MSVLFRIPCITLILVCMLRVPADSATVHDHRLQQLPAVVLQVDKQQISRDSFITAVRQQPQYRENLSTAELLRLLRLTRRQQLEKILLLRLMQRDGIAPCSRLCIDAYHKKFRSRPAAERRAYLQRRHCSKLQLEKLWRRQAGNKHEQFRVAFAVWIGRLTRNINITNSEVEQFYRENQDKFHISRRFKLQSIIFRFTHSTRQKAREHAEDTRALCQQGVAFPAAGNKYCSPLKKLSGIFTADKLPQFIRRQLTELKPGRLSPIIELPDGFVICKMINITKSGYIPLSQAAPVIKLALKKQQVGKQIEQLMQQERQRAEIIAPPFNLSDGS